MKIEVLDEHLRGLNLTPERLRIEAAVGLYARQDVTLGQAATIAGISQTEFMHELGRHGICIHYGTEDFEQDLKTLDALRRR
jgi:predicted HTH domain antitoxin